MGKLAWLKPRVKKVLKVWWRPFGLALIIFFIAQYFLAGGKAPDRTTLEGYLGKGNIPVSTDSIDGYQQVYYTYNDVKVYISSGQVNHINPKSSQRYVSWFEVINGSNQLFIYDLLDKTKIQLSFSGSNFNQVMEGSTVAWERILSDQTQIFVYEGHSVKQLSNTYESSRPRVGYGQVLFTQKLARNKWRNISYTIALDQYRTINETNKPQNAYPHFVGDQIKTGVYD